jgi:hypothetical protein
VITSESLVALLEKQLLLLHKLQGEKVGGYAIIVPPSGEPILHVVLSSDDDEAAFYSTLAGKMVDGKQKSQLGGVRVPGMR